MDQLAPSATSLDDTTSLVCPGRRPRARRSLLDELLGGCMPEWAPMHVQAIVTVSEQSTHPHNPLWMGRGSASAPMHVHTHASVLGSRCPIKMYIRSGWKGVWSCAQLAHSAARSTEQGASQGHGALTTSAPHHVTRLPACGCAGQAHAAAHRRQAGTAHTSLLVVASVPIKLKVPLAQHATVRGT